MMAWFDYLNPNNEFEHECRVCGSTIEHDGYCSTDCAKSDDL